MRRKDEAWETHLREHTSIEEACYCCFVEGYAAACQPSTLEMLEALAKRVEFQVDLIWRTNSAHDMSTLSVGWETNIAPPPHYRYWRRDYISGEDKPEQELTRDKALTLLKGGGDALHS